MGMRSEELEQVSFTERLMDFGLTRQEANIYQCLLTEGKVTGYEVAKQTGISRSNAYNSLANMTEKGAAYLVHKGLSALCSRRRAQKMSVYAQLFGVYDSFHRKVRRSPRYNKGHKAFAPMPRPQRRRRLSLTRKQKKRTRKSAFLHSVLFFA